LPQLPGVLGPVEDSLALGQEPGDRVHRTGAQPSEPAGCPPTGRRGRQRCRRDTPHQPRADEGRQLGAGPQAADARVKTAVPSANARLAPVRSAHASADRIRAANADV
jgi:hypothetical protein